MNNDTLENFINAQTQLTKSDSTRCKRMTRRRGATIVELALLVPVLLVILLGIIEFSWIARNHLTLAN